jgi:hypothetical protein
MTLPFLNPRRALREASQASLAIAALLAATFYATAAVAAGPKNITLGEPTGVGSLPHAPANVPRDYVVTPNGFFHPSCVQRVDADETLHPNGTVVRGDGSVRRVQPCAYPHYAADGTELARDAVPPLPLAGTRPADPQQINGWVAYASYVVPRANAAVFIAGDMSVPDAPTIHSGQVVYFFQGLEDLENVQTIVQPVLGWNAFNDNRWTIASWNCCLSGETWHSAPVAVDAGVTVEGRVSSSNCTANICEDWAILTRDPVNDHDTTLNTNGYGQAFDWVFGGVLEAYGISQCGELPVSGVEEFTHIMVGALRPTSSGRAGQPLAWDPTIVASAPNCSYVVTPHPQQNSPQITISY